MSSLSAVLQVVRCNPTDPDPALASVGATEEETVDIRRRALEYIRDRDPDKGPVLSV
jgi:hypothetical protein